MTSGRRAKKNRDRGRAAIEAHRRLGNRLITPMNQIPQLHPVAWLRDLLPDMLWLCYQLNADPTAGLIIAAKVLDAMDDALKDAHLGDQIINDGRLSNFEAIPAEIRPKVLATLHSHGLYGTAVPETLVHILGIYPDAPGRWLIQPRLDRITPQPRVAEEALSAVVSNSWHGQGLVPTRAKFMVIRGRVKAGKVSFAKDKVNDLIDALPRYPAGITEEERRWVEPSIRALFGGFVTLDDSSRQGWAKTFWQSNWRLFACRQQNERGGEVDLDLLQQARKSFIATAAELNDRFQKIASKADPDLYDPDRYEVLTGIAARAIQIALAASATPAMWSSVLGSPALRAIAEALIVVRWLIYTEASDPLIYRQFKEYGRGRLKLFKLHLEEYIDTLKEVPDTLNDLHESVTAEANEDLLEWFQDVQLSGNFSKQDLRTMATAVGMQSTYRLVFRPASSEVHGEWPVIDRSVLERCGNPLHGGHRVVRPQLGQAVSLDVVELMLTLGNDVINAYRAAIETQP